MFVESQEICSGVYTARCIVITKNPLLKVINTTDEFKSIENCKLNKERLDKYYVYTLDKAHVDSKRLKDLAYILEKRTPPGGRDKLITLIKEYADIFALEDDTMSVTNFYEQKLRLVDNNPVYIKNYRLPYTQRKEINRQVDHLLQNKLIEPSQSDYNSPLILVPKKVINGQKTYRMCVDFRAVNKTLIADKFPLPRVDDILVRDIFRH